MRTRAVHPILAIALSALLAAVAQAADAPKAAPSPTPAPPPKVEKLVLESLGERMWRLGGVEAGAVLVLDGEDGLLIVDTQDSTTAEPLDAELGKLSKHPVRMVINTHYHLDHTRNNDRYRRRGATVIAHANVPVQALKDTMVEDMGWHRKPLPSASLPTITFADSLRLSFDGEDLRLWHPRNAHTDGDLMIWMPKRNLIHTGDIVEVGAPPFVDWWAGGTLDGMIAAVDQVLAMSDAKTRIVPGHGDVVDRAWVERYRTMLVHARDRARAAIAAGTSLKDFADSKPLAEYDELLGGERRSRRLAIQSYFGLNGLRQ